jgi:GT2 family glycosyltransferase
MQGSRPRITTIIPTYRRPRLLARAIRSVLEQAVGDFQVIVYDNASGDETASVVAEFAAEDSRVSYCAHSENIGAFENFNCGLRRVDTQYFSLLSDDDLLLPHFYEQAMRGFADNPSAMVVAAPVILVDERQRAVLVTGDEWAPRLYPPPSALLQMARREHFIWTAMLFRREVLEVGVLDAETGLSSDLDLMLRIASRYPIAIVPRPGAIFTIHKASPSSYPRLQLYWPSWARIIAKIGEDAQLPPDVRQAAQSGLERRLASALFRIGILSCSRGYDDEAWLAAATLQSRYGSRLKPMLLRGLVGVAQRVPGARQALHAVVNRLRWRRRGLLAEAQHEVDQHAELLRSASGNRQDAAA